ncbi:metal-sulfur cluster biosynthetic enzyme [Saccharopolyspora lacisalsi]|uniref:Metal-sulfur cluster biosynthetic enzyme n=1 Tax=Halosaccharopolyspora lacisalsi TaxID=1000566 RepID=A0A839E5A2_9PSEU|nr:iron-sulfur cluster assembly protein [Halosaccharopolyspora lacisalsi]MBA8826078.1 metal-sulfur cluster biosynthetic enzyme [Halosaccharopolyspora lacisalsi]
MSTAAPTLRTEVWRALGTVLDPELDESVTELGFVASLRVDGPEVRVELRLPTYFCAPNFAYLMVADAHDVLTELPGVTHVQVRLLDHFASDAINTGVAAADGFDASFPGLATGELDDLRRTFLAKAHSVRQEQLATGLLREGRTHQQLLEVRLRDLPGSTELTRLQRRRERLAIPSGPDALLMLDDRGRAMDLGTLPMRLRLARTTRVGVEANAGWCRGLLSTRYGDRSGDDVPRESQPS